MTEDIDKTSLACDIMSRAMSPSAKFLWPIMFSDYRCRYIIHVLDRFLRVRTRKAK